jgi:hypothetical protein
LVSQEISTAIKSKWPEIEGAPAKTEIDAAENSLACAEFCTVLLK